VNTDTPGWPHRDSRIDVLIRDQSSHLAARASGVPPVGRQWGQGGRLGDGGFNAVHKVETIFVRFHRANADDSSLLRAADTLGEEQQAVPVPPAPARGPLPPARPAAPVRLRRARPFRRWLPAHWPAGGRHSAPTQHSCTPPAPLSARPVRWRGRRGDGPAQGRRAPRTAMSCPLSPCPLRVGIPRRTGRMAARRLAGRGAVTAAGVRGVIGWPRHLLGAARSLRETDG
jgi:hypothetical protein